MTDWCGSRRTMDLARPQVAVEALLECSVCMDQFETSGPRIPKMLPCQHSFCCECVKNIHDGTSLACPSCRKVFYMPPDDLPNTFILLQLIDINASEKRKTELKCEKCPSFGPDVKAHCGRCIDEIIDKELIQTLTLTQRYDDRRKPSLETARPVVQPEQRRTDERASDSSRPVILYILVAGFICFGSGFLFSVFYVSLFNFFTELMKFLTKNATVFGKTIMKNIPEVFNFAKIILFQIFDVIYLFLRLLLFVILPSFFRMICDFFAFLYEILTPLFQTILSMVYHGICGVLKLLLHLIVMLFEWIQSN